MNRFDYNRPNTRERIAARRRVHSTADGSFVTPMPRRVIGSWIRSGWIASLALLIAGLGGLLYISLSPWFTVQDLRVEGAVVMDDAEVAALAGARDQTIWFVQTEQIVERLKTSPYIEDASVAVELPDRLQIVIIERRPEVRWQSGANRYLVDAEGLVLGVDAAVVLTNTLVIDDRSGRPIQPNERVDTDALSLGQALALRLPRELNLEPASIGYDAERGMLVATTDNRTIVFGRSERLDEKLAVLGALLTAGTPFTYLDLRPSTPFYRNDSGNPDPSTVTPEP